MDFLGVPSHKIWHLASNEGSTDRLFVPFTPGQPIQIVFDVHKKLVQSRMPSPTCPITIQPVIICKRCLSPEVRYNLIIYWSRCSTRYTNISNGSCFGFPSVCARTRLQRSVLSFTVPPLLLASMIVSSVLWAFTGSG